LGPTRLTTARLLLRPTVVSDAGRAFDIQSDWNVTRMLRMARFPPDQEDIRRWFADHRSEWRAGEAYRFGVECAGKFIGLVDIDEICAGWGDLGYWFERASWGHGYALEAAPQLFTLPSTKWGSLGFAPVMPRIMQRPDACSSDSDFATLIQRG